MEIRSGNFGSKVKEVIYHAIFSECIVSNLIVKTRLM